MSDIPFTCPSCGQAMQIEASAAGGSVGCVNCGQPVLVPLPRPVARRPARKRGNPAWTVLALLGGLAVAWLVFMAAGGIGLLIYVLALFLLAAIRSGLGNRGAG